MSVLIWRADQQGKASAVFVLAAALRAAAEVAPDERQPAAHEAGQITQADAIMQRSERELIQRCSATMSGGSSEGGLQLADMLQEAANALLEAAVGPLGGPLRRHLLSAAADVNYFAGGRVILCINCRRCSIQHTVTIRLLQSCHPLPLQHTCRGICIWRCCSCSWLCQCQASACWHQGEHLAQDGSPQQHAPLSMQRCTRCPGCLRMGRHHACMQCSGACDWLPAGNGCHSTRRALFETLLHLRADPPDAVVRDLHLECCTAV